MNVFAVVLIVSVSMNIHKIGFHEEIKQIPKLHPFITWAVVNYVVASTYCSVPIQMRHSFSIFKF